MSPLISKFPSKNPFSRSVFLAVLICGWAISCTPGFCLDWQRGEGYRFADLAPQPKNSQTELLPAFSEMLPEVTGVKFTNVLTTQRILENNNYMNGSGVAAGDFDGDGLCDLYFCAIAGTNALYRNTGSWHFEDVTARAGAGLPEFHCTGAIFSDIDGDGDLDLLVAALGKGVRCLVNDGRGGFREAAEASGLASSTGSTTLAMADIDGDGDLDLYVANYGEIPVIRTGGRAQIKMVNGKAVITGPHADRLRYINGQIREVGEPAALYLNEGHGRFARVPWSDGFFVGEDGKPMEEPWDFGLTAQMRDINGDGFPDIYVCNDFETPDRVWINNGRGRFRALATLAMRKQSFASMGVDFADVNRDGLLDFFVVEMLGRDHARRQRQMFSMPILQPAPGLIDNRPEEGRNMLFLNRGDGSYAEIANFSGLAASDWSWHCAFVDVDLDGYEDLLVATGMPYDILDHDTLDKIRSFGKINPEHARTNLLLFPSLRTPNAAFRNEHDLKFKDVSSAWGFDSRRISNGMALADLDGDGDLDVVINCLDDGPLLYRNNATAPRIAVRLSGKAPNTAGIGGLIRVLKGPVPMQMQEIIGGGRYLSGDDAVRVFAAKDLPPQGAEIQIQWRNGKRSTIKDARPNRLYVIEEGENLPPADPSAPAASQSVLFRDASGLLPHTHREEFFDDYVRQPLLMKVLSQLGPGAGWVDLDGDGHDELALGTGKGGSPEIFRQNSSGRFDSVPSAIQWNAADDTTSLAAWASSDGTVSLLAGVARYESLDLNRGSAVRIDWPGNDHSLMIRDITETRGLRASPGPLAVADMDGDGSLDLFVGGRVVPSGYPIPAPSQIFRQNKGRLVLDETNSISLIKAGLVSSAVWSDLDSDGYPELVLACEWGSLRVFHNDKGTLRPYNPVVTMGATLESGPVEGTQLRLSDFTGLWNGVNTGDFDEDGKLDIVASNWGLNDAYHASFEHPLNLYFDKAAGRVGVDLIESYYAPELNSEVPRRTWDVLSPFFPQLAARYSSHLTFSTATMTDVSSVLTSRPQKVSVTTLASMLFLNRGSHFVAVPLPAEAQFAPAFSITVGDADGDGHDDVFLSQNFFGMRPGWPRLDGGQGLWLRGDGTGRLRPVPASEAGIHVHGEQRGAALGDYNEDGRVDLVVTQNGAATRLFENVGAKPGLRVKIKGPPGNPLGIGALVRLQMGDRMGPIREFHGGGGYWSQDSLVQVFGCPQAPEAAQVIWPGGRTFSVPVPHGARELVIDGR